MEIYECRVIVFIITFCWGSVLHPATEIVDDHQREGLSVVARDL